MKLKSILNKAQKLGLTVSEENSRYSILSENKLYTIEFHASGDDVHALNLRRLTDKSDSMTDYHAGSYYYKLNACFESMLDSEQRAKEDMEKQFNQRLLRIELERLEGPTSLCIKHTFDTLQEYKDHISKNLHTFSEMGYDKHKINIVFADGDEYGFRLDAQHPLNEYFNPNDYNLMRHIQNTWKYASDNLDSSYFTREDLHYMAKIVRRLDIEYKKVA